MVEIPCCTDLAGLGCCVVATRESPICGGTVLDKKSIFTLPGVALCRYQSHGCERHIYWMYCQCQPASQEQAVGTSGTDRRSSPQFIDGRIPIFFLRCGSSPSVGSSRPAGRGRGRGEEQSRRTVCCWPPAAKDGRLKAHRIPHRKQCLRGIARGTHFRLHRAVCVVGR